jgi:hypothetical protein
VIQGGPRDESGHVPSAFSATSNGVRLYFLSGPTITLGRTYDLSSDGQRFLMIKEGGGADQTAAPPVPAK